MGWNQQLVTLQGTNISPQTWHFEDDFPCPKVGYVNFLEGIPFTSDGDFFLEVSNRCLNRGVSLQKLPGPRTNPNHKARRPLTSLRPQMGWPVSVGAMETGWWLEGKNYYFPSLTWNPKRDGFQKRNLLFKGAIFRFHVKCWECTVILIRANRKFIRNFRVTLPWNCNRSHWPPIDHWSWSPNRQTNACTNTRSWLIDSLIRM